jgi:hypothetical protein
MSDRFLEAPERAAGELLSQVDTRSADKPPSLSARGLLNSEDAVESDRVADAALPVHLNDPLNTVNQIIVCPVVLGTEGPHGVVL